MICQLTTEPQFFGQEEVNIKRRSVLSLISSSKATLALRAKAPMQTPAAVLDFFQGPPGGKLKVAATAQLALALLSTIWASDVSGSLAVLGILAVVTSNQELLKLVFNPPPPLQRVQL